MRDRFTNAGDGKINAFNPTTGAWMGALSATDGTPITIDGLHGIAFGNGLNNSRPIPCSSLPDRPAALTALTAASTAVSGTATPGRS